MKWVLFLFAVLTASIGRAQDLETRLAYHNFAKADVNEGFSVLIERASLHESNRPLDPGEPEEDPSKPTGFVQKNSVVGMLKRLVVGKRGKWQRVDGVEYSFLGPEVNLRRETHVAELIHDLEGWFYMNHHVATAPATLERFRIAGGVVQKHSTITRRHPFDIAWSQATRVNSTTRRETPIEDHRIIEEKELPDGRMQFLTFIPNGSVFRITFNKDEPWCVEDVEFWTDESLFGVVPPKTFSLITKEMFAKNYTKYATNRTKWQKIGDQFVPVRTLISSNVTFHKDEFDLRFTDWKFGKDVDEALLDEANFTVEAISKSIDFEAVRNRFEKLREDEERTKR